ncbi:GntR family transcriptional regulator [Cupriavidus sp. TA19]|uniref:FadR/GntR family transcriptional regulator n=1 Tax=unclassified Cupriavidus TaxID=2640874 RepID=UPI000E2F1A8A|nr:MULTISPECIES: GntR family transcriptional regulator [unclassified Cupriavidus]BDB29636.1 FadR family transcriptional regulator [Cupriavidus sp. P-10]GLC93209.1 GntR family transcriptional regulator [Cupriavidus sp. TA19]
MANSFPLDQIPDLQFGTRLSEQLAQALSVSIRDGQFPPGQRLPTESALMERFGVSRTVVREALSRLKTLGLVESRQGSGAFVKNSGKPAPEHLVLAPDGSVNAVIQMVEVRRALEAESAALAAARCSPEDLENIKATIQALEEAVVAGGDGVAEDVAFHAAVAKAACNPFLLATLSYLNHFLLDATRVTRANEATRADFAQQVRDEHAAIVRAIESGDVVAARFAAAAHMANAAERIGRAAPDFWAQQGRQLAERLRAELGAPQAVMGLAKPGD